MRDCNSEFVCPKNQHVSGAVKRLIALSACFLIVSLVAQSAWAADRTWTGIADGTDWNNAGNWDTGTPVNGDNVIFNDGFSYTLTNITSNPANFDVSGGGAITLGANLTMTGNFTLDALSSFNDGAFTINIGGNFDAQNSITASGTINFNSTTAGQSTTDGPFNNFQVNKSGQTLTANASVTINGALTVTAGTFDLNDFNLTANSTTTVNGGTLTLKSGSHGFGDAFTLSSGTFNAGSGDVSYGDAITDAIGISNGTFNAESANHNLYVTNGSGTNSTVSVTIFNRTGGTFNAGTSSFIVATNRNNVGTGGTSTRDAEAILNSSSEIRFYNLKHTGSVSTTTTGYRRISFAGNDSFYIDNQYERSGRTTATQWNGTTVLSYFPGSTLNYTMTGVNITADVDEWPATNSPTNVTGLGTANVALNNSRTITGTLDLNTSNFSLNFVTLTITGVMEIKNGRQYSLSNGASSILQVNGTLRSESTGSTPPINLNTNGVLNYGSSSLLEYAHSGNNNVTVGSEWSATLTPFNVKINHGGSTNKTVTLQSGNMSITEELNIASGILASGNSANTLSLGGNLTTGTLTTNGQYTVGTLVMVGDQSQDIVGGGGGNTIANLDINKTNTTDVVTLQSGILAIASGGLLDIQNGVFVLTSAATNLDVTNATFRVQSGGTYRTGGKSVTITGSTIDFQAGSTYEFNGTNTTEQFITSGATTNYGNVIINNTNATPSVTVPAGKLIVIQNNLTMTNGLILSGATNSSGDIEVDGTASSSGTSYVNGPLRIKFPSGIVSRTYPIGFSSNYRPATFAYTANNVATSIIEIEALSGDPSGTVPSGIAQIATSHYYTVKEVGTGGTFTYDITLTITGTGFTPVSRNKILIQNGATPDYSFPTQGTASGSTQTVTGLTALPTNAFKVAFGAGGAVKRWDGTSGNWSVAANWEDDALPLNGDEILLNNALQSSSYTVTYNTATTATTFSKIAISATAGVTLQLDKSTTIDLTDGTTGLDISDDADSRLVYNGTNIGMAGGGYDAAKTSIGSSSTVEFRAGTVYADDYGNLTINTTGTLSSTGTATVAGSYTKQGSGSHTMSSANLNVTGTSTITSGTLAVSGTGSLTLGTVTNSGTIDFGASGINSLGSYSGSGAITGGGSGSITFSSNVDFGGSVAFGSQALTFQGDVTLTTGGSLTLSSNSSFTGNSNDFEVNGGAVVTSAGTLSFQTGTGQTITGNVTFPSLTINNTNDVTVSSGSLPTVSGTLTLTDGLINFASNADYLTLNSAASISGGSSASYVNGKVRKIYATGSNITGVFPVGKPTGRYQPVTISVGTVTGANQHITVEQIETNIVPPLITGINSPLVAVSRIRYWNVAYTANGGSMTNPTIRLSWDNSGAGGISDGVAGIVGTSSSADVVIARQSNGSGNWNNLGQSAFTGTYANGPNTNTGTVTSNAFILTDGNADFVTFGALNSDVSLPVELTLFEAIELENVGHVKLVWRTESEIENAYWFVQKKTLNSDFVTIATIDGQGSKTSATDYQFIDANVKPGDSVSYRLADIAYNGDIMYHKEKTLRLKVPERFELLANYPNPFNPTTTISYKLPKQSRVHLTIYNILGQKVRELVRGELQDAGVQRAFWDSRNDAGSTVSTGIYIYRLQIGNFNTSRKMILMK